MEILKLIVSHVPDMLAVLGALGVAAGIIAKLTPNKTDDAVVAKIEGLLAHASTLFLKRPAGAPSKPE